jgi:hypothetical protein
MSNRGKRKSSLAERVIAAKAIDDLWPDEIAAAAGPTPPITILKQQAALLGRKTKNLVEAEVHTEVTDFQRLLRHTLFLVAPVVGLSRYPLLSVEHPVTRIYPAIVKVNTDDPSSAVREFQANDEAEFKHYLKTIFAEEPVKRVIGNLLAQSAGKSNVA